MAKLFISYRRKDSQWQSKAIYTKLAEHVGNPRENIFFDLDSMTLGYNFRDRINDAVAQCEYLLAMIGPRWLNETDEDSGERRLDNPNDFVRLEIAAALERGIPVIPVMLDGTPVPPASALPEDLKELALRHGVKVRADSFDADVYALIKGLKLVEEDTTDYAGEEWELINESLQIDDYQRFARRNPKHIKALEAERRIRQLTDYADVDQENAQAIADFRKKKGETDPLFEALKNQTKREMDRAARFALIEKRDVTSEERAFLVLWVPHLFGAGFIFAALSVIFFDPLGWLSDGSVRNKAAIAIPGPIDRTPPPEPIPKPAPPEIVLESTLNAFGNNIEMRTKEVQDFLKDREFMVKRATSNGLFGPTTTISARAFAKSAFENWPTADGLSAYKEEFEKRLGPDLRSETRRTAPELIPQYWLLKDYISQNEAFFEAVRGDANGDGYEYEVTAWDKAREGNTIESYNAYLDQFPNGLFPQQARDKIIDLEAAKDVAAWATALRRDTIGAYDYYKATNPNGMYRGNADIKIMELKAQNSGANDDQSNAISESQMQFIQTQVRNGPENSTDNTTNKEDSDE